MYIKNIKLKSFRSYSDLDIELTPNINIFYGNNGVGKTNILESIYISAITKSYRTYKDIEIINFNEDYSQIIVDYVDKIDNNLKENNIKIYIDRNNIKKIKENEVEIKKYSEYIGKYNIVIFSPESMDIIKGAPKNRRKFLDLLISQISKKYLITLQEYNKIVILKNNILKNNKNEVDLIFLDVLDEKISGFIEYLSFERKNMLEKILNKSINIQYQLTNEKEKIEIKYISDFENLNQIEILEVLKNNRNFDFIRKTSTKGIQKDDFEIYINDININKYGSQGQNRTVLITLKLSEIEILKEAKNTNPILLLDDVFSELDNSRINYLLDYIRDYQVIITTTDVDIIDKKENMTFFEIINGTALQIKK